MLNEKLRNELLSEYEEIIGFSSSLFSNTEWSEFEAFKQGYIIAMNHYGE